MDERAASFDSVLAGEPDGIESSDLRQHLRVVEIGRGRELLMEGRAVVHFASNGVAQAIARSDAFSTASADR